MGALWSPEEPRSRLLLLLVVLVYPGNTHTHSIKCLRLEASDWLCDGTAAAAAGGTVLCCYEAGIYLQSASSLTGWNEAVGFGLDDVCHYVCNCPCCNAWPRISASYWALWGKSLIVVTQSVTGWNWSLSLFLLRRFNRPLLCSALNYLDFICYLYANIRHGLLALISLAFFPPPPPSVYKIYR